MSKERVYYVYIAASRTGGALYIGITSDLLRRIWEHKEEVVEGFTKRYNIKQLVYFEQHTSPEAVITREKQMKKWRRQWKVELIEKLNPFWSDLFPTLDPN